MFGLGTARSARRRRGVAVAVPRTAPGYLATIGTAPYAVYGAQRVVLGYAGNLFRLRRASDAATLDVACAAGSDFPDLAAISAWAAGALLTVTTIYDQSGNARHLTQATVANQPVFDPGTLDGGTAPIVFDGFSRGGGGAPLLHRNKFMTLSGIALDRIAHTILTAGIPQNTQNTSGWSHLRNAGASILGVTQTGGLVGTISPAPRTSRNVWGYGKSATGNQWRANGATSFQSSASTTQAIDEFNLGTANVALPASGAAGAYKMMGAVLYNAALSAGDGDTVANSLLTAIAAPTVFDYRLVWDGDSIMEGTGSSMMRTVPQLVQAAATKRFDSFTTALHGQTMATIHGARVARFGAMFAAGRPNVIFVEAGINDITTGTTGANLYANSTGPLITYLKGLGFKVGVATLLPFDGNVNYTGARETERLAYNALVRGNSAAADAVVDVASDSIMGPSTAPPDTNLYVDNLHPTSAGYARLATLYRPALESMLGFAP